MAQENENTPLTPGEENAAAASRAEGGAKVAAPSKPARRPVWIWLMFGVWVVIFGVHLVRTYSAHEMALLLPIAATLMGGFLIFAKRGAVWLRVAALAFAALLWFTAGIHGGRALMASQNFRHFPAEKAKQIMILSDLDPQATDKPFPPLELIDAAHVQKIISTFQAMYPCWSDANPRSRSYSMAVLDTSGREHRYTLLLDNDANPPTVRVLFKWRGFKGAVRSSEYYIPKLYEELRRDGLR